jgi:hypothetical protein
MGPESATRLHLLDEGGVLFNAQSHTVYVLNATAAFVWCCLEDGLEGDEVLAAIEQDYGVVWAEAEKQIDALLLQWQELGLLGGPERNRGTGTPPETQEETSDATEWPPNALSSFHSERSYRLLNTSFRLRYGTAAYETTVHPVLAHLETAAALMERRIDVDLAWGGEAHLLLVNGRCKQRCALLNELAPLVKGIVLREAIDTHPHLLYIHAGVVRGGCGCLLLPAEPGSGKTSLTAALTNAGFSYLSDELAPLEGDTLRVRPVPVSLCIKDGAWDLLTPRYPEMHDLAIHHRWDGKIVRYLNPPPAILDPEPEKSYPVRWIVFPQYSPEARTELRQLGKADALHRLLEQCLAMPAPLDQTKVASLVSWIRDIPCYELPMSSLDEAVSLIDRLCRPGVDRY